MKEKEQAAVCVDEKGCTEQTRNTDKEIFDDSCFKTPLLLPPRRLLSKIEAPTALKL
ncbi:hypothetical protein Tcan_16229 [Toxocara canis]|uniref:Uncharacterized protein n=1 Tax=Toxocara canis TaxID=6265 RepID=A0A0B2UXK1_TOXCA|nr:hypothetical protein Tcan_16229 [Toxocara canis]